MAFNFVNTGARITQGIQQWMMQREMDRQRQVAEANAEAELNLKRNAQTEAQAAREAAQKNVDRAYNAGRADIMVNAAGAETPLPEGAMGDVVKEYRPDRVVHLDAELPSRSTDMPVAAMTPAVMAPVDPMLKPEDAPAPVAGPMVPGIVQRDAARVEGDYLRPSAAFEEKRTAAEERASLAKMAAIERARIEAEKAGDKVEADQRAAELRVELAKLASNTQLTIAAGNQAVRREALDVQKGNAQEKKDAAAVAVDKAMEGERSYAQRGLRLISNDLMTMSPDGQWNLTEGAKQIVGTDWKDAANRKRAWAFGSSADKALKGVQSILDLNTLAELKRQSKTGATGFGSLSAPELAVLENASASLQAAQDETTFLRELKDVYRILDKVYNYKAPTGATPGAKSGENKNGIVDEVQYDDTGKRIN